MKLPPSQLPRQETWDSDFSRSSPLPSTSNQSLNSVDSALLTRSPSYTAPLIPSYSLVYHFFPELLPLMTRPITNLVFTSSRSALPPGKSFYTAVAIMLHIFQRLLYGRTSKHAKPFKRQSLSQFWNVFLAVSPSSISILLCYHPSHEHKAVQEIFWINISGSYSHRKYIFLDYAGPLSFWVNGKVLRHSVGDDDLTSGGNFSESLSLCRGSKAERACTDMWKEHLFCFQVQNHFQRRGKPLVCSQRIFLTLKTSLCHWAYLWDAWVVP